MDKFIKLGIGAPYPLLIPAREGAAAHLCIKGGSFIQIMMPGLTKSEKKLTPCATFPRAHCVKFERQGQLL